MNIMKLFSVSAGPSVYLSHTKQSCEILTNLSSTALDTACGHDVAMGTRCTVTKIS